MARQASEKKYLPRGGTARRIHCDSVACREQPDRRIGNHSAQSAGMYSADGI